MGLVMICVAAPARREAAKKSVGERWDLIWAWVSFFGVVTFWERVDSPRGEVGSDGAKGSEGGGALRWAMSRSKRDLKKKKEAQLVALPMRFGVRPR